MLITIEKLADMATKTAKVTTYKINVAYAPPSYMGTSKHSDKCVICS